MSMKMKRNRVRWELTAAAFGVIKVHSDVLPEDVKAGTANGEVEVVWGMFVDDACVREGGHKQNGTAEAEGADEVSEHDSRRFDANLDIIPAILASVDRVFAVSAALF
jgi:hypothetical protein